MEFYVKQNGPAKVEPHKKEDTPAESLRSGTNLSHPSLKNCKRSAMNTVERHFPERHIIAPDVDFSLWSLQISTTPVEK